MKTISKALARRSVAALATVTTFGAMTTLSAAGAHPSTTPQTPQVNVSEGADRAAESISHISGRDNVTGEPISATTREVNGAPVVTGTATDGTDADAEGSTAARAEFIDLSNMLANGESPGVENSLDGPVPRLGSDNVYDTAVAISQRAWKVGSASTVYITRADRTADALAAGALKDGPILFVPRTGTAPSNVISEIKRLAPSSVIALGGENAVSSSVLKSAGAGRPTSRIAGANSYQTAVGIARRAFPNGSSEVYLAGLKQGPGGVVLDSPDAAAGGALSKGPVLPVPSGSAVPAEITSAISSLSPANVYALGGTSAVTNASLSRAAGSRSSGRLTGADRYATSATIAKHAYPGGAKVAYLVAGNSVADAVAGGSLSDGPILFAPPAGSEFGRQTATVANTLNSMGVRSVGALSAPAKLPSAAISAVVSKAPSVTLGPLPAYAPPRSPAPATKPTPKPTPAPPAVTAAPAPSKPVETCDSLVKSFRPVPLPSMYKISCADSIQGRSDVLGLTTSRIYVNSGQIASGEVVISRNQSISMMKATIAHEIAHAYSYGYLSRNQRTWFTGELMKVDRKVTSLDFGGGDYNHMPAEQWARGQATCSGWPDPFKRPTASCQLIKATIATKI